ncbi:MAG: transcriptional coactivator p15/PC4 family protein [Reyranella sp.]|nr:transcriptional coactivator p15/PC4 family protein [Reyranella sp.]
MLNSVSAAGSPLSRFEKSDSEIEGPCPVIRSQRTRDQHRCLAPRAGLPGDNVSNGLASQTATKGDTETKGLSGAVSNPPAFPISIAEWHKSAGHVVRVSLDEFKGQTYVNARVWYTDANGEFRPSKNGVGLAVRHLPDLIRAFQDAAGRAYALGVLNDGGDQ